MPAGSVKAHEIHFVTSVAVIAPHTLRLQFEDGTAQSGSKMRLK
jgi:hypothetical protein